MDLQPNVIPCGPLNLTLAGIPPQHPDNFFHILVHQYLLEFPFYSLSPSDFIAFLRTSYQSYTEKRQLSIYSQQSLLQSYCDCFGIIIHLYYSDTRRTFHPEAILSRLPLTAHVFSSIDGYDSVQLLSLRPCVYNSTVPILKNHLLKFSTWNVRGSTQHVKQLMIDFELSGRRIDIACLQETHTRCRQITSPHYFWILGPQSQLRASRGLAFLLVKSLYPFVQHYEFLTSNIGYLCLKLPHVKMPFYLVNCHKSSDGDVNNAVESGLLTSLIRDLKSKGHLLFCGDLNSHLGYQDPNNITSKLIGTNLFHPSTNQNGEALYQLCTLLNLKVMTTFSHRSTLITWTNGQSSSQIDHVLSPEPPTYKLLSLEGRWSKANSDHKLLDWKILLPYDSSLTEYRKLPQVQIYRSNSWDYSLLELPRIKTSFNSLVEKLLAADKTQNQSLSWDSLTRIACFCAEKILKRARHNFTPDQQQAYNDYNELLKRIMHPRTVDAHPSQVDPLLDYPPTIISGDIQLLRTAFKKFKSAGPTEAQISLNDFLDALNDTSACPIQKLNHVTRFVKKSRRSQVCAPNITMAHWENELKNVSGLNIELLPENDYFPNLPPPTYCEMLEEITSMKNGKCPGLDKLAIEMLKSSESLCQSLYLIIRNAYINNNPPTEWHTTFSVPIPKKARPSSCDDNKKILVAFIYKFYFGSFNHLHKKTIL